ncbi:CsbD family protein [Rhodovulum tesquicola]|uniref:CsbD family protein n=1 Tax=Rhodovulum strictum TaxID=58314 RepID=A0A844BNE0_9RHOB|nr:MULTISPECIES: CsbD family protein [Rhodovulum]MCO8146920.1 CsbD family protein [Rhodovulum tesquicola]MRH22443.1 CsbD family protein [Rhodovulum strictum]
MNMDELKGNWKQVKGRVREAWGVLTDDEVDQVEGNREQLVGLIQSRYGKTREVAEKEVDEFLKGQ